jgi:hypothetical protein
MKIEITNLTTAETITIARDVTATHPQWVHDQLVTESESELQDSLSNWSLSDYYSDRSGEHLGADEYGVSLTADESDYEYRITDGNAHESADSLDEAKNMVEDWYDYLVSDEKINEVPTLDLNASSVDALNDSIRTWEQAIAQAMGKKDFAGHDNYLVTAADEAGLNLRVEKVLR